MPSFNRYVLDEAKRNMVIALVSNGSSRRVASRYVGCAPATITRTAQRDPEFALKLARAEHNTEVKLLRAVQIAATKPKFWRAAAWLLERTNPDDFAARSPKLLTMDQVTNLFSHVVDVIGVDLPDENRRRALRTAEELILEYSEAGRPIVVQAKEEGEGMKEEGQEMTADAPRTETEE